MQARNLKSQLGHTIIELIIFTATISIVLVIILQFSWNILGSTIKIDISTELNQNTRFVLEKYSQKIRIAEGIITGSSTFGAHPGVLTLDMSGTGTDLIFDTYTKSVTRGGKSVTIRKLRMKDGAAAAVDLTSDKVNVTNFYLKNLSRGDNAKNINLELTLAYATTGDDPVRDESISIETATTIRKL